MCFSFSFFPFFIFLWRRLRWRLRWFFIQICVHRVGYLFLLSWRSFISWRSVRKGIPLRGFKCGVVRVIRWLCGGSSHRLYHLGGCPLTRRFVVVVYHHMVWCPLSPTLGVEVSLVSLVRRWNNQRGMRHIYVSSTGKGENLWVCCN